MLLRILRFLIPDLSKAQPVRPETILSDTSTLAIAFGKWVAGMCIAYRIGFSVLIEPLASIKLQNNQCAGNATGVKKYRITFTVLTTSSRDYFIDFGVSVRIIFPVSV